MRSTSLTAALMALLLAAGPASPDDIYVSGRLERISSGDIGGGGGIEWYRTTSPRRTVKLGVSAYALPGARWGSGGGGATLSLGRTVVAAEATVGYGDAVGSFQHVQGGVTQPLGGQRLLVDAACHYVGGRTAKGGLAKAGLTFLPRPSLILQAGYFRSFSGTLGSELAVVKVVSIAGPRRYLIGGSIGRSSPSVLGFVEEQRTQSVRHVFGGAAFPLRTGGELLVILEHYELQVVSRSLLSLTWKVGHR